MLNERIKELRNELNISQAELGKRLRLTQQAIAKWEKGISEPDSVNLHELSEIFDVSTDYLLGVSSVRNTLYAKKEPQTVPSDVQEFYDLLIDIGVRDPNKKLSPKAKERLFNLVKNNANLIVEDDDKSE